MDFQVLAERAQRRFADGESRLDGLEGDQRQKQLVRMANAAYAAGLAWLMEGREAHARDWLRRAAETYRESHALAPPQSWGRPIGAVKARVIAADWDRAETDAKWSLDLGAADADSPIGRYAAALASLVLGQNAAAARLAKGLQAESADVFSADVADALSGLGRSDPTKYESGVRRVLASFEARDAYLEDVPVADTVLVLEALAGRRQMAVHPSSDLLPSS